MMKMKLKQTDHTICLSRVGLFLLILAMLATATGAVGASDAPGDDDHDPNSLFLSVERTEEGACCVLVSEELYSVTAGEAVALLLCVILPQGYAVTGVEACGGADGLTLTAGEMGSHIVRVLLDGYPAEPTDPMLGGGSTEKTPSKKPQKQAKTPLFCVFFTPASGAGGEKTDQISVSAPYGGEVYLYLRDGEGKVRRLALAVLPWEEGMGDIEDPPEEVSDTETVTRPFDGEATPYDSSADTEALSEPSTDPEGEGSLPPCETAPAPVLLLGCRETPVRNGTYTVQFIFAGQSNGTPVVCAEGGGVLSLRVSAGDPTPGDRSSTLRLCTFSGLREGRRYRFLIYLENKTVAAVYEDGVFLGYFAEK